MKKYLIVSLFVTFPVIIYAQLRTEKNGFIWESFYDSGYIGAKNSKGKIIIPSIYKEIEYVNGCFIAKNSRGFRVLYSEKGKNLMHGINDVRFVDYDQEEGTVFLLTSVNKKAAINNKGELIVPEDSYSYLKLNGDKRTGYTILCIYNGYSGIISLNGKKIVAPSKFDGGVHKCFYKGKNYYYCNTNNLNGLHCVLDEKGKELFRTKYRIINFNETDGCFDIISDRISETGKGKISLSGKIISQPSPIYEGVVKNHFNDGFGLILTKEGKQGVCGENGEMIVPALYDNIIYFYFWNFFEVYKDNKSGAYNKSGKCIIEANRFTSLSYLDGYFKGHESNGLVRLFDDNGREILRGDHSDVDHFKVYNNGTFFKAINAFNSKVALFDTNGIQLTPYKYTSIGINIGKDIFVYYSDKVGIYNIDRGEIIPPLFSNIEKYLGFYKIINGNKVGICDKDGKIIVPVETFSSVEKIGNNFVAKDGLRICKFSLTGTLLSDNQKNLELDNYLNLADQEFEKEHYKKAADYYKKAIEISPSATFYFNVGVSYYNNKNYNLSVDYFMRCLNNSPSQNLIDRSKSLIASARQLQSEKEERRGQIVAGIFGLVLGATSVYIQSQYCMPSASNKNHLGLNTDMDYLLDPTYTINQVNRENWNEYIRDTNGGQTMSFEEWYANIKAPAINAANDENSGDVFYSKTSSVSDSSQGKIESKGSSSCRFCYGTGNCQSCLGKGSYLNPYKVHDRVLCPNCKDHNGKCTNCNGTGKKM